MLTRNAESEEKIKEIDLELDKPLPGEAKRTPSAMEQEAIRQEWASFMQSVG